MQFASYDNYNKLGGDFVQFNNCAAIFVAWRSWDTVKESKTHEQESETRLWMKQ